jgi:hypothetical protein
MQDNNPNTVITKKQLPGHLGTICDVLANVFKVEPMTGTTIYQYNVSMTPSPPAEKARFVFQLVELELVKTLGAGVLVAYDGQTLAFSAFKIKTPHPMIIEYPQNADNTSEEDLEGKDIVLQNRHFPRP